MQYRKDKYGNDISLLGYGCMRFTKKGTSFDFEKAEKEIMKAFELGVNYYDTAYIYSGSEVLIGEIFEKNHIREKINIATKLPPYFLLKPSDMDRLFNEQCKRLRTDYIDYYLMHMLTDIEGFRKLEKLGFSDWVSEKKASGQIRNIGFSFHGKSDMFIEILNAYDWDFAQIQYNYLDEHTQAGVEGLKAAAAKGIPVIIMEPLRGGKLVNGLPQKALDAFASVHPDWTPAEWGLRWLWNQSEVTCVLSGMNSTEMVEENCRIASAVTSDIADLSKAARNTSDSSKVTSDASYSASPALSKEEYEIYDKVKAAIMEAMKVPCTGCSYCMPCPKGVDIPSLFASWNNMYAFDKKEAQMEYLRLVALRAENSTPNQCVQCGKCESHCPQSIKIREMIKQAEKDVFPWYMKIAAFFMKKMMFKK